VPVAVVLRRGFPTSSAKAFIILPAGPVSKPGECLQKHMLQRELLPAIMAVQSQHKQAQLVVLVMDAALGRDPSWDHDPALSKQRLAVAGSCDRK
jgi:hypothetical protein